MEFQRGLNIICGASDTGKSFLVEAVDFLLGGGDPLRDIPARVGYDRARLILEQADGDTFTIERSTSGGGFRRFDGIWLSEDPEANAVILREKHAKGRRDTLSALLLSIVGLEEQIVRRNKAGETRTLSFRDLARLVIVQEGEIIKRFSPIFSGQWIQKTVENSVFKLLLTGVDDSAVVGQADKSHTKQGNSSKVELIDEWIAELYAEIDSHGIRREEAEEQLAHLTATIERQRESLKKLRDKLDDRLARRRDILLELEGMSRRIEEVGDLFSRFALLKTHYNVDLERLAAIEESGCLFMHLDRKPCPLCGALPEMQHQDDACAGNIETVVHAATAEIAKIRRLLIELDQTVADLTSEAAELNIRKNQLNAQFSELDREIRETISPDLGDAQSAFSELVEKTGEIRHVVDMYERSERLEGQKRDLLETTEESAEIDIPPYIDLSKSVLDDFATKVKDLLNTWGFPGCDRVYFDEASADIVINGQPRASRGKGLRAITHAAMTIGLMEFCKERALPHPGFVVLDSPLLAYWAPEGPADSLQGSDLKERFYEYLADTHRDSQVIIIENEHPQASLHGRIGLTVFTKNPQEGRYGFFPFVDE
ncbi:MAG TPA: AAA family ATPase [Syntrophobacteraceae bacterium]|nr:AAA family ATPase [Syntrophobacteraceae bacterium]